MNVHNFKNFKIQNFGDRFKAEKCKATVPQYDGTVAFLCAEKTIKKELNKIGKTVLSEPNFWRIFRRKMLFIKVSNSLKVRCRFLKSG